MTRYRTQSANWLRRTDHKRHRRKETARYPEDHRARIVSDDGLIAVLRTLAGYEKRNERHRGTEAPSFSLDFLQCASV